MSAIISYLVSIYGKTCPLIRVLFIIAALCIGFSASKFNFFASKELEAVAEDVIKDESGIDVNFECSGNCEEE